MKAKVNAIGPKYFDKILNSVNSDEYMRLSTLMKEELSKTSAEVEEACKNALEKAKSAALEVLGSEKAQTETLIEQYSDNLTESTIETYKTTLFNSYTEKSNYITNDAKTISYP